MAPTITATSFTPSQPSPLARSASPTRDPRTPPPSTPRHTAKLWDEYERRALENEKRRETTCGSPSLQAPQLYRAQRCSNGTEYDIIDSYDPYVSAASSPHFDFEFATPAHHKSRVDSACSTTVAICKTCKQGINSASGICEQCKRTIVFPSRPGESTPPLTPSCRNFASTDLPKLHKDSTSRDSSLLNLSPKRRSKQPASTQLSDPPIRLSSLRPALPHEAEQPSSEASDSRKASLTDPNEPFLRLQIVRKPVPRPHPASPTTPPSSSNSHKKTFHTRPSSLANITTPPQYVASYSRHVSATPSELSTLYPYISNSTTTPPSVCRTSYSLQNTTSAWEDWGSDDEEKAGLVGYWRGKKWRGSRGSLGGASSSVRRDSADREESTKEEGRRRRRGFVRVISCGCGENE